MPKQVLTFQDLRRRAEAKLKKIDIESAAIDTRLLLMAAADCDASDLIVWANEPVSDKTLLSFNQMLERRLNHEPVAYILGHKEFWSLDFDVSPDVLIPRPETELVVEKGLALLKEIEAPHILDIGTGSGAILISLLHERKDATGLGTDISSKALELATTNAKRNGVIARASFHKSNFLDDVDGRFDLIVSNPPYITADAMTSLSANVEKYEPHLALSGGEDGLMAYREIIGKASKVLKPNAWIVLEIGFDQGLAVSELLGSAGFGNIYVEKDLAGHDRMVCGKLTA